MSSSRLFKIFVVLLLLNSVLIGSAQADNVVYLSSLEWPPYVGKNLPENGKSAKIVREAFAVMGYDLKITFVPWKRAMRMAESYTGVVGYFPEYYSAERAEKYIFSKPYSCSTVGLLMRKKDYIHWDSVEDLAGLKIGFVAGYVNTKELDAAVVNGVVTADYAPYDESNIIKVALGRVDAAVVDPNVYNYILESSSVMLKYNESMIMHEKKFGVNNLYVAFNGSAKGRKCALIFNEGLKKIQALHRFEGCETVKQ